jgi:hypothetical protein
MVPSAIAANKGGELQKFSQEIDRIPLREGGLFYVLIPFELS